MAVASLTKFTVPLASDQSASAQGLRTSRWRGVTSCAVLCSPDVPPVPGFPCGTSDGLASFTQALSAFNGDV